MAQRPGQPKQVPYTGKRLVRVHTPETISFHIISLGCSKNLVDSEFLQGTLESAGFEPVDNPDLAQLLIINTCGFIQDAKEESIDVIFEAIRLKEDREIKHDDHSPFVVVTGCLSQRYRDSLISEIPEIDFVYGLIDEQFLPGMARALDVEVRPVRQVTKVPLVDSIPYRYIKIAEGCSNNCSYCAIPLIRGPHLSYSPEEVLNDAALALRNGAMELNIVAQDIAAYRYEDTGLKELVDRISAISDTRFWIRLLYCHPDHTDDSIIDLVAGNDKVVPYIDIPLQHVSAHILKSMGRTGNSKKYEELITRFRGSIPGIRVRSTFMVGYPGETHDDFNELMDFVQRVKLDRVGCFMYSPEEDTAAALLGDTLSQRKKQQRYEMLMKAQKDISIEKNQSLIGSTVTVLVEEQVDDHNWIGRTQFDAPEVDGIFFLTGDSIPIHSFVQAIVTDALEYDLSGETT